MVKFLQAPEEPAPLSVQTVLYTKKNYKSTICTATTLPSVSTPAIILDLQPSPTEQAGGFGFE